MSRSSIYVLCVVLLVSIVNLSCGGGDSGGSAVKKAPISVTLTVPTRSITAGDAVPITASVNNDTSGKGVRWSMTPNSAGQLTNQAPASVTFQSLGTLSANVDVTITATSAADTSKSASVVINVHSIAVFVTADPGVVGAGGTVSLTATVNNDTDAKGVTWSISPETGAGTLSNETATSVTYNAPATPPASDVNVTVTATSVADPAQSGSATFTLAAIQVGIVASSNTLDAATSSDLTAQVSYDPSDQGVTWSLSPASGAGSLSNVTSTSATYNAPSTAPPSDQTVNVTAQSIADTSKSAVQDITVFAIEVSLSPKSALIPLKATQDFTPTVSHDPDSKGVSWSVLQGGAACASCGSASPTTTASGTATTYTAPASLPSNAEIQVSAASISDSTKTAVGAVTLSSGAVKLVPYALDFGTVKMTGSKALTVTLSNTGASSLTITSIATTKSVYTQQNTCGGSVAAGAACTITVTFKPTSNIRADANLVITDSSSDSPQQVPLTGVGIMRFASTTPTIDTAIAEHTSISVPAPTGPTRVGTRVLLLKDFSRKDPFVGGTRELMVRMWYPMSEGEACMAAAYTTPKVWSYFSQLKGIPLPQVHTNSCQDAAVAQGKHPVVVFTHGYTGTFTDYTFLFEDLASRGYVVASVDHTYEATAVEFPGGKLVRSRVGSHLSRSARLDRDTIKLTQAVRIGDLRFVSRELTRLNSDRGGVFAGKLDTSRMAVAGHSLGGRAALVALSEESRFKAGVSLDGVLPEFSGALEKPVLLITSGNDGWPEDACKLWNQLTGKRLALNLRGSEHITATDAVWLAKFAVKTGNIGPDKTIGTLRESIARFLDVNLRGESAKPASTPIAELDVVEQQQPMCQVK